MTIRLRTLFFIALTVISIWFLYLERAILTPFILAAIFAYIFNPIVNFFTHKIKLPRSLSIIVIYLIILGIIISGSIFLTQRIFQESSELSSYITATIKGARTQINTLPSYIKPVALDGLIALEKSRLFSAAYWVTLFPQAISRIVSFFLFLVAGYYFLKEGNSIFDRVLNFIPRDLRVDMEIVLRRMNKVFASYLRGQVFLVVLVSAVLFLALYSLGVRFALIIAIFSGFAEIVPIFGPIIAGAIAAIAVLISGTANFPYLPNWEGALVVVVIYFVVRHLEDYFVIPYVMGRIVELHPLVILFAVLSGGHLFGVLGLILAVPIAGVLKILFVYSLDKINEKQIANKKAPGK
jgi:predicted PurR-regulated permease PerM